MKITSHVHIDMGRFRKNAPALQEQAELPRSAALRAFLLINYYCIEKALASDFLDQGGVQRKNSGAEYLAEILCAICELLVLKDAQGRHSNSTSQGVPK